MILRHPVACLILNLILVFTCASELCADSALQILRQTTAKHAQAGILKPR